MRAEDPSASAALGLAEESGYNLVAPLGYSTGDWYGSPALSRGGSISFRQEHQEIKGDLDRRQGGTELLP